MTTNDKIKIQELLELVCNATDSLDTELGNVGLEVHCTPTATFVILGNEKSRQDIDEVKVIKTANG